MPRLIPPILTSLLAVVLFAATALLQPARPADALTNCSVSDLSIDSEESAFLTLINNYRASKGAGSLTMSANLNRAATWHATDMATKSYFSHTDSLGRNSNTRMMQCDVKPGGGTAENIAAGTNWDTAQEAFDAWVNSSGHEQNMVNGSYKQIGISRVYVSTSKYKWYWVTDFSTQVDGTNPAGGSTGGGTAPTPTPQPPTPPPAVNTKAAIQSPVPGSQLAGEVVTFSWNAGSGAREYFLYVGTSSGSNNIHGASTGTSRSATVDDIPTDGRTIYVRLWTRFDSGWQATDYTYRAAP